ncbi:MAG: sensor histidine kinase [Cellulomonadaceae bacterium]
MTGSSSLVWLLRRFGVRRRLMLTLALVTIVPVFATTWIVSSVAARSTEEAIQTQSAGTIGQVADSVAAQLAALERSAVKLSYAPSLQATLAGDAAVSEADIAAAHTVVAEEFYLTNHVVSVQVSADGSEWTSVFDVYPEGFGITEAEANHASERMRTTGGQSVYTAFRVRDESARSLRGLGFIRQWRTVYALEDKQSIGVIVLTLEERYISSMVSQVNEIPGSRALLVDETDYTVVSNVGQGLLRVGDDFGTDVRLNASTPSGTEVVLEDTRYRAATAAVANSDLMAVLLLPADYIFASRSAAIRGFVTTAAVAGVAALALSALVAQTITQPIRRLMDKFAVLESVPDMELPPDPARDELAQLDHRFNELMTQNRQHAAQRDADVAERHRMELKVLQAQINPHFVVNALASMRQLAVLGNAAGVAELGEALSGTVNRTFRSMSDWTTLEREFEAAHDYAVIASYRNMGRVALSTDLPHELEDVLVPQFIIQPIVENAYVHGWADSDRGGRVVVRAQRTSAGDLTLEVTDNGAGLPDGDGDRGEVGERLGLTRFGLRSVQERLRLLYGDRATMTISSEPWIMTTVTVEITAERSDA